MLTYVIRSYTDATVHLCGQDLRPWTFIEVPLEQIEAFDKVRIEDFVMRGQVKIQLMHDGQPVHPSNEAEVIQNNTG